MPGKYPKNTTNRGFRVQYNKPKGVTFLKNQVLQFRIELLGITPTIWRRILVPSDYNFWDLHVAIQDSMGWRDSHLHHFEIRPKGRKKAISFGIPDIEGITEMDIYPGWEFPVFLYFKELGAEAKYIYDYGDSWVHQVRLEGYLIKEKGIEYPLCIGGERACPPEDCGGPQGYYNLIKILYDPENVEYEETKEWTGKDWHPDLFYKDLVIFDDPLKRLKGSFSD